MQVISSPLATTEPGHSEKPERAEPSPLIDGEGLSESPTQVSHETAALALREPSGEPGSSTNKDSPERTKSQRRRGWKKTSTVAVLVEAASPPKASREEEETPKAKEEGESWEEDLVEY